MLDFQEDNYGYGDDEPTVVGGEMQGYEDAAGYDEYGGGYEGFDVADFEPEDLGPQGPIYVQAHTSKGLDLFAMFASILMACGATFLLGTRILNGVYDNTFFGILPAPYEATDLDAEIADYFPAVDASMETSASNDRYRVGQPAPPMLKVLSIGNYTWHDGKDYSYAILTGRSTKGLFPGLLYYVPSSSDGSAAYKDMYLVVTTTIDKTSCRADFVKMTADGGKLVPLDDQQYMDPTLNPNYIDAKSMFVGDPETGEVMETRNYEPPYMPRRRGALSSNIVAEALAYPTMDDRSFEVSYVDPRGGPSNPVDVTLRRIDPNPLWNPIEPVAFGQGDLDSGEIFGFGGGEGTSYVPAQKSYILLQADLMVRLAPLSEQKLYLDVLRGLGKPAQ